MERNDLLRKITKHLDAIYGEQCPGGMAEELVQLCQESRVSGARNEKWNEKDAILITYPDSINKQGYSPLYALRQFAEKYLKGRFSAIHILPFYPASSDGGFAVMDYVSVNKKLGTWDEFTEISQYFSLMYDFVANHVSQHSKWFTDFLLGKETASHFFIEMDPAADYSAVARPCTSPLMVEAHTASGVKHVWATFSQDQIDLNYRNPVVLREMIGILAYYLNHHARIIRIGGAGFLWKEAGTACLHLPQAHEIIRLFRTVSEAINPSALILTETNIYNSPNADYFADGSEAQLEYQNALPALLLHALFYGTACNMNKWIRQLPQLVNGCAYINVTATHDGIALLPADGFVSDVEITEMLPSIEKNGCRTTSCLQKDGSEKIYEVNTSYFDALRVSKNGDDGYQVPRFICSQAVAMSLRGIPAIYIHSLLATPNDLEAYSASGIPRHIHRKQLNADDIKHLLKISWHPTKKVFFRILELLEIRKLQPAFHPDAAQEIVSAPDSLLVFRRLCEKQELLIVSNLSSNDVIADLQAFAPGRSYTDVTDGAVLHDKVNISPYGYLWIQLGNITDNC